MVIIVVVIKLVFISLTSIHRRIRLNHLISVSIFFGIFESHNLDSLLAVIVFVDNTNQVNHRQDAMKYGVIVFVSLFSLFMISMYLFMAHTVSRLTDSYFKHALLKIKDMKDESMRFLLEDKNMHGNIFQRHFNLVQLFKDIVFAALLYALYYKPLVLIILLTIIQAVFMACVFAYPPYNIGWMNTSLRITQTLYLILDLFFFALIAYGSKMNEGFRYYVVGFSMIAVVCLILAFNIGFSIYSSVVDLVRRFKKNRNKKSTKNSIYPSKNSIEEIDDSVVKDL